MRTLPKTHVMCSHCGKRGHTRRNTRFHKLPKFPKKGDGYSRSWWRAARLRASMRETCVECGEKVEKRDKRGNPATMCDGCAKHKNDLTKGLRARRRLYEAVLREIASGSCVDPVARALVALGQTVVPGALERRAA